MFNMFEELFAPGRKHTNDERKRLELSRVDLTDGDPGRGPIDLSSGKVVVRLPKHEQGPEQEQNTDHEPDGGPESESGQGPEAESGQGREAGHDPGAESAQDAQPESGQRSEPTQDSEPE
ncbi:DUF6191 domain-containing protein [Streptomyces sp. Tue6028]|uniref:DUF6191 domain-containing protein n=1 Tax=Streptomyces sp. Tue6028 TaxID=2036037 RepID=UPI003EBC026D